MGVGGNTNNFIPSSLHAIAVADINGDGIDDIILGDNSSMTLRVFLGQGNYKFKEALSLPLPKDQGFIWNITVTDLNNDNRPDFAVNMVSADNLGGIRVFVSENKKREGHCPSLFFTPGLSLVACPL